MRTAHTSGAAAGPEPPFVTVGFRVGNRQASTGFWDQLGLLRLAIS